jgi:dipeptidyl-peptidase 4
MACVVILLGCEPGARGQGTRADYERAAELASRWGGLLTRDRVRPNWLPDHRHFWYRIHTGPDSHEFILVDAEAGERRQAFDAAELAAALRAAGAGDMEPERLPLEALAFDLEHGRLEFGVEGRFWRWGLEDGKLEELDTGEAARPLRSALPRASRRTGPETAVTFINRTGGEVELIWLDTEGARRSYGRLDRGERRRQHTYAGHAWLVVEIPSGRVLDGLTAEEEPVTLEIRDQGELRAVEEAPLAREQAVRGGPRAELSPDGRWAVRVRDHNLWLRDVHTGEERALSTDGAEGASFSERVYWSPNSLSLAALRVVKGEDRKIHLIESSPSDQTQPRLHTLSYAKPGDRVDVMEPRLFRIAAGEEVRLTGALYENPFELRDLRWSADGSRFTFVHIPRGHQGARVVSVEADTGMARAVVDEASATFFDYAHKLYARVLDATEELIWMSERDGWNHLYLIAGATGGVKSRITSGPWVVRGVDEVDVERREIWFRAGGLHADQDPYHVHYARVRFDGTGLVRLTAGDGTHTVVYSPDRRYLVATWSRVDHPPVTELRRTSDGGLILVLERADVRPLIRAGWHPPERFVAKGRDGVTDIYGIIHRPTQFNPQSRYPVLEEIYAGPQGAHVPKAFRAYHKAQALAELGFVVVQIDGMGTSHRSKAFHDVSWQNLGDAGFPDRIAWIQSAARQEPAMDLSRVGIYGGSAGGQNAVRALIAHGDFYQVAVADCGCHDNRVDKLWWNELWMGWPVGPHYLESSNVTQAHRLQGKLLLVVGELDRNVDPASTLQLADALVKANKDFDLLLLPGVGHGAAETPYGTRRRQDFFVRHLLGAEPRRPSP